MSVPLSDAGRSEAAFQLLLIAHRIRDLGVEEGAPYEDLTKWLDHFFSPADALPLVRLQHLLDDLSTSPKSSSTGDRQLLAGVHLAIRAIAERTTVEKAIQSRVDRAIYDFAYGLTHEINNPLANIAARAQQLLTNASDSREAKSLATIVDQAMRAHEMLAEMMRVVKPPKLDLEKISLNDCLQNGLNVIQPKCRDARVELNASFPGKDIYVLGNHHALTEAFASLLGNSLEACTPGGEISVLVSLEPNDQAKIVVSDTGRGIPPELIDRAFNLYFSGREHGRGLGISLANAKRVIQTLGGEIAMRSHSGAGAEGGIGIGVTVEVYLPISTPPHSSKSRIQWRRRLEG